MWFAESRSDVGTDGARAMLLASIGIDALGCATYFIPGLAEGADVRP